MVFGSRKGGMHERRDRGNEGCWNGAMQDRRDGGQEGCRKGGIQDMKLDRHVIQEKKGFRMLDVGQVVYGT